MVQRASMDRNLQPTLSSWGCRRPPLVRIVHAYVLYLCVCVWCVYCLGACTRFSTLFSIGVPCCVLSDCPAVEASAIPEGASSLHKQTPSVQASNRRPIFNAYSACMS